MTGWISLKTRYMLPKFCLTTRPEKHPLVIPKKGQTSVCMVFVKFPDVLHILVAHQKRTMVSLFQQLKNACPILFCFGVQLVDGLGPPPSDFAWHVLLLSGVLDIRLT